MKKMLVFLMIAALPLAASAATLTYDLRYEATYSGTTNIGDKSATFNGGVGYDPNWSNRFGLYLKIDGLAAGEDLNQFTFGFTFNGGVTNYNTSVSSVNTDMVNVQVGTNEDGDPTYAMRSILANGLQDSGNVGDNRGWMGTINAGPAAVAQTGENSVWFKLCTVRCKWNGTANGSFDVFGDPPDGSTYTTWVNNTAYPYSTTIDSSVRSFVGDSQLFTVPEPATMGLLALGALGMLRRRR